MNESIYKHPSLPISAPAQWWRSAGYTVYSNSDTVGGGPYHFEEFLILALAAGKADQDAIAWAIAERQRRSEQSAMTAAVASEASAIAALAGAINSSGESEITDRILSRVSERTRYAIKQQLGL